MSHLPPNYRLQTGQLFEGRYRILRELGSGGFGMVYLAHQETMGRHVALKVLTPGPGAEEMSAKARFLREVQIISKLRHPNTVTIHDFGETVDGIVYMVLEYIEGETLKDLLRREGAQDPVRALMLICRVARSVAEAHQYGIVHRDLKPANIMITNFESEKDVIKVLDFGVARLLDTADADLTAAGTPGGERALIGTPRYMSPEQVRGQSLGPASDIYSMGLILYETLIGEPAVQGDTTMSLIMQQISPERLQLPMLRSLHMELQRVIRKATEKEIANRYLSATDFGDDLENVAMYLGTSGRRISAVLPIPSLIRHSTGSFSQHDPLTGSPIDAQETRPHIQALKPQSRHQNQPLENNNAAQAVALAATPQPYQQSAPQNAPPPDNADSFLGLVQLDLPPPRIDTDNPFASEVVEPPQDSPATTTPNIVEPESIDSSSTQWIILLSISVLAVISTFLAFLFLSVIVNHFLSAGLKFATTLLITLAIPALTILSESSRTERFEVIIQPIDRIRRVALITTLFSFMVVILISILMPGAVIQEFRGNPNWYLRSSDAVTSKPGKLSSLNRSISFSLASGVELTTRSLGLYKEKPPKKDTPPPIYYTPPPPSTRPGNPNIAPTPDDALAPNTDSEPGANSPNNTSDKPMNADKKTRSSPPEKRSPANPPSRSKNTSGDDYIRW